MCLTFSLSLIPPIMGCMCILKDNIIDYHCHLNLLGHVLRKMNNNHAYLTPCKWCFLDETECYTHRTENSFHKAIHMKCLWPLDCMLTLRTRKQTASWLWLEEIQKLTMKLHFLPIRLCFVLMSTPTLNLPLAIMQNSNYCYTVWQNRCYIDVCMPSSVYTISP